MRTRVGVIFGGRSREHEISILSAAAVISAMDRGKYEPVPFAISKDGGWYHVGMDFEGLEELTDPRIPALFSGARRVTFEDFDNMTDFALPMLHGPFGEDGTIQGLFEMLCKPYAGPGVAEAAVSMDKVFMKEIWHRSGLPQCGFTYTTKHACSGSDDNGTGSGLKQEASRIEKEIPYPIFIKPANMGSSVGVSKVENRAELEAAIEKALLYDKRVIAEATLKGRELEIGVLGNGTVEVSAVGEILVETEYYDYDSKYRGSGTKLAIPADIPEGVRRGIEALAERAYRELDGEGFARIDMFYDEEREQVYLSEMNSIPGFTRFSMFPRLWEAKGLGFSELVERIIELGYERHNASHYR